MTVPIATSPGRSGFGPQLSLSYDSGAGNGPFGFGWSLSLPPITRKTDKGLPQYRETEESDVFILSGAEDLVPVLVQNAQGEWERESLPPRTVNGITYRIRRYRPRIEGLFARIERWTNTRDATDVFWRSISKDNITTWYGKTAESRIADPADPSRIFSWLICESHDDKGNVIVYGYKARRLGADLRGRSATSLPRPTNATARRVALGAALPQAHPLRQPRALLPDARRRRRLARASGCRRADGSDAWLFEVVFDYGEHDADAPTPSETRQLARHAAIRSPPTAPASRCAPTGSAGAC